MLGSQGTLVIKLKSLISIENISIEHISKNAGSDMRTSLKDFKIYGMNSNDINDEILLVEDGLYDIYNDITIQTYSIKNNVNKIDMIKLYILSNYGNDDYTCLYNIRVNSIME
jgi:SUN domain-containing protein 1/2